MIWFSRELLLAFNGYLEILSSSANAVMEFVENAVLLLANELLRTIKLKSAFSLVVKFVTSTFFYKYANDFFTLKEFHG